MLCYVHTCDADTSAIAMARKLKFSLIAQAQLSDSLKDLV